MQAVSPCKQVTPTDGSCRLFVCRDRRVVPCVLLAPRCAYILTLIDLIHSLLAHLCLHLFFFLSFPLHFNYIRSFSRQLFRRFLLYYYRH